MENGILLTFSFLLSIFNFKLHTAPKVRQNNFSVVPSALFISSWSWMQGFRTLHSTACLETVVTTWLWTPTYSLTHSLGVLKHHRCHSGEISTIPQFLNSSVPQFLNSSTPQILAFLIINYALWIEIKFTFAFGKFRRWTLNSDTDS